MNDRGRVEYWSHRSGHPSTSIYDFGKKTYIHTNGTMCTHGSTDHLQGRNFMGHDGHLSTTEQFFALADNKTHTYTGTSSIRGILCDTWTTDFTCSNSDPTHPCDLNYTLTWTFASSAWSVPESNMEQVPVRIEMVGKRTARWGPNPYTYDIFHSYDFTTFHVGELADADFEQPCGIVCVSMNRTWTPNDLPATPCPQICSTSKASSDWTSSQVGGLAFGMVVLGVVVALLGMYIGTIINKRADFGSLSSVRSRGDL